MSLETAYRYLQNRFIDLQNGFIDIYRIDL
jgi:hypothetical protein